MSDEEKQGEDQELQNLLEELSGDKDEPKDAPKEDAPEENTEPVAVKAVADLVPVEDAALVDAEGAADEIIDIKKFVAEHTRDYDSVRDNLRADRAKTDGVIQLLLQRVQDEDASATECESLVKALEILAKTNDSAVKLLDSRSRLIASTKSTIQALIQQNFGTGDSAELQNLLDQPDDEI